MYPVISALSVFMPLPPPWKPLCLCHWLPCELDSLEGLTSELFAQVSLSQLA